MARKKTFTRPALGPMNEWARSAFIFAEERGEDLSYSFVADEMTKAKVGGTYDKSMVQKMTTERKVSLAEAQVISRVTGFPLPDSSAQAASLDDRLARLSERRRQRLLETLADLEAAEAVDRLVGSSGLDAPG